MCTVYHPESTKKSTTSTESLYNKNKVKKGTARSIYREVNSELKGTKFNGDSNNELIIEFNERYTY